MNYMTDFDEQMLFEAERDAIGDDGTRIYQWKSLKPVGAFYRDRDGEVFETMGFDYDFDLLVVRYTTDDYDCVIEHNGAAPWVEVESGDV